MQQDDDKKPLVSGLNRRAVMAGIGGSLVAGSAFAQFPFKLGGGGNSGPSIDLGKILSAASNLFEGLTLGEEDEIRIGNELYGKMVDRSGGSYRNRKAQGALERFALPMLETSKRPFDWEITILNDNAVNAWALPGGKMAINKGLLRYVKNEDELAAVISHEIGHAELSHGLSKMRSEAFSKGLTEGGRAALSATVKGADGRFSQMALDALEEPLHNMMQSGYSREAESEADMHIIGLFKQTGFDPRNASGFFETLIGLTPASSEETTSLFSTHPGTKKRIDALDRAATKSGYRPEDDRPDNIEWGALKKRFPTRKKKPKKIGSGKTAKPAEKKSSGFFSDQPVKKPGLFNLLNRN